VGLVTAALDDRGVEAVPPWLEGLNPEQHRAATFGAGALLVLAGAGTGKTKTLVSRVAHLLSEGVAPERVLLLTFSRRAADEMVRRVGAQVGGEVSKRILAGTFHAVAHHVLRTYGSALGLPDGFSVLDAGDSADLLGVVRAEAARATPGRFPKKDTLASVYSRVVNAHTPLEAALTKWFPWCADQRPGIASVFEAYTARKREAGLVDFDDLLLYWRAAALHPSLGPHLAALWDHILVDEYQDTNAVQSAILRALRQSNGNLTVVGDDAQAIYSFRAATVRNILDFPTEFPASTTITLDRSYRSTQPVLDLANAVIAQATEAFPKTLRATRPGGQRPILATCPDEAAQSQAVCETILWHYERGVALRDQAVLVRAAHHSDALEVELRRRHLPFVKYGGLKFLEAAHLRDLLALLRLLDNPADEMAWQRVLLMADGVGPAAAQRLLAALGLRGGQAPEARDITVLGGDALSRFLRCPAEVFGRAAPDLEVLRRALADCTRPDLGVGAQIERLTEALGPLIRRRYDHPDVRLRDLSVLAGLATTAPSRHAFVADLTLDPPRSTGDLAGPPLLDDDYLTLSTVHSAKGGEWPVVHIIHAADGMFPSDMATGDAEGVDEERRLFYVALTRARDHLHLYTPLRYYHGGPFGRGDAHSWAQRTRFLPPDVEPLLELRAVRAGGIDDVALPTVCIAEEVDRALHGLW
jgi:DNA helicase-2/ATP-dependent DNA helicase PcrA